MSKFNNYVGTTTEFPDVTNGTVDIYAASLKGVTFTPNQICITDGDGKIATESKSKHEVSLPPESIQFNEFDHFSGSSALRWSIQDGNVFYANSLESTPTEVAITRMTDQPGGGGKLEIYDITNTGFTSFRSPDSYAGDVPVEYVYPTEQASDAFQVQRNDGTGVLSWGSVPARTIGGGHADMGNLQMSRGLDEHMEAVPDLVHNWTTGVTYLQELAIADGDVVVEAQGLSGKNGAIGMQGKLSGNISRWVAPDTHTAGDDNMILPSTPGTQGQLFSWNTGGVMSWITPPFPPGYMDGFEMETSPASSFGKTYPGKIRDSTNTYNIEAGAMTFNIAGTGPGGLLTGTPAAATWYNVWVIADSTGVLIEKTALSVFVAGAGNGGGGIGTLPSGYDIYARIALLSTRINSATQWKVGDLRGNGRHKTFMYSETPAETTITATWAVPEAYTPLDVTPWVPLSYEGIPSSRPTEIHLGVVLFGNATAAPEMSFAHRDLTPDPSNTSVMGTTLETSSHQFSLMCSATPDDAEIFVRSEGGGTLSTLTIYSRGYTWTLLE